ncbi:MAG: hypothetical protein AAFR47_15370 [Pseudomonadota bacterium]
MEILLKCVFVLEFGRLPKMGHNHPELWKNLPTELREDVLHRAKTRMGPHADLGAVHIVLADLRKVFLQGRYSYEVDKHRSDKEVSERGADWMKLGMPEDKADFRYRPIENDAAVYAFGDLIQERLGLDRQDVLAGA